MTVSLLTESQKLYMCIVLHVLYCIAEAG